MNFLKQPKWWMRVLIGAIWIPVGGETFLRFLAPVPMLPRYIKAGPHGVRANMPNQTYRHQTPEYTAEIRINSQGMRADQEFAIAKPSGTKRIAVIGDSFSMGDEANIEDTSLHILEENLEAELECNVEILNFSVSGFGPAEELIVLETTAMQYEPDLVIQYYSPTDPIDDTRANLFVLNDSGLQRANDSYLPKMKTREFFYSLSAYRWLAGESHLYNLLHATAGLKADEILTLLGFRGNKNLSDSPAEMDAEGPTAQEALTLAILSRMMEVARAGGAEFLILSAPLKESRSEFKETFPDWSGKYPVVSPIASFEEESGSMKHWEESHGHWTPLGCRLVASELTDTILDRGLLGAPCR